MTNLPARLRCLSSVKSDFLIIYRGILFQQYFIVTRPRSAVLGLIGIKLTPRDICLSLRGASLDPCNVNVYCLHTQKRQGINEWLL